MSEAPRGKVGRLVITGALGHIGSRFIHGIRPGEYKEVILIDNLLTQRYCSLFNLPKGVPFKFIEADICSCDLKALLKGADAVLHLAAITNAEGSFDKQKQVEEVNYEGTKRVAEACVANGCGLIFLSTTSVYGTQSDVVDEDCSIDSLKPQSPYAESKLKAERLLAELGKNAGLKFVTCRFGTIYGASIGMRFHTAVNKFVWQACMGIPVTVWRTAMDQQRPYLDLGDAVRAINFILAGNRFDNELYNVLTDNASVADIIAAIKKHVPDLGIKLVDSPIMNQLSYKVACEKFRALGFEFKGNLDEGVKKTIDLLRQARGN
ncbi:MAG: NAD(P)-dependent oxidoreductase [Elusimicrobiales bacterium]|nr:NAD(P)-dependent oxidoreductase [Elusimicrobiales bacterium]